MPISADQWRVVVGSNSVRRPRQVISIEQLLLRYLSKIANQQDGGGPQDATLSTLEDATVDGTGPSAQTETLCTPKGCNGDTMSDVEAAEVMRVLISAVCVQVLQSFVSMVNLSLLILSGDVETNPGPTDDIDGIAKHHGLTPDQLDVPCDDGHLLPISKLIANWNAYAGCLGLSDQQTQHIQTDITLTVSHQRSEKMLKMWQENSDGTPNSHYRHLLTACIDVESNRLLAGKICDVIKKFPPTPVTPSTKHKVAPEEGNPPPQHPTGTLLVTDVPKVLNDGNTASSSQTAPATPTPLETLLRNKGLTEEELDNTTIETCDLDPLADRFDDVKYYINKLSLTTAQKTDVKKEPTAALAMRLALENWKGHHQVNPTFKALLLIVLDVPGKSDISKSICDYYKKKRRTLDPSKQEEHDGGQDSPPANQDLFPKDTMVKDAKKPGSSGYLDTASSASKTNAEGDLPASDSKQKPLSVDSPNPGLYCGTIALSKRGQSQNRITGGASGQSDPAKLWATTGGKNVLKVYFINEPVLTRVGLNAKNIMERAKVWSYYNPSGKLEVLKGLIPTFTHTSKEDDSDIRIKIVPSGRSETAVGIDAKLPSLTGKPTMVLGLRHGNDSYNDHIVTHEFGHALGLEHEHQRSKFWDVAKKFLDISKMRQDPDLQNTDIDYDYLEKFPLGGSQNYDPESIMHYWFRPQWLKDQFSMYEDLTKVESATDTELSPEEKKVLLGIHKRNGTLAQMPSDTDYEYLAREYYCKQHGSYLRSPSSKGTDDSKQTTPPGGSLDNSSNKEARESVSRSSSGPQLRSDLSSSEQQERTSDNEEQDQSGQLPAAPDPEEATGGTINQDASELAHTNGDSGENNILSTNGDGAPQLITPNSSGNSVGEDSLATDMAAGGREDTANLGIEEIIQNITDIAEALGREEAVSKLDKIKARLHSKTSTIGFIGATSSGKSTTINALLGGEFLPSSAIGETAYVLCIKHDPNSANEEGELHDVKTGSCVTTTAEKICEYLEEVNETVRSNSTIEATPVSLELRVHFPFLAQKTDTVDIAIYDTPGTSENQELPHCQATRDTYEELIEGIVIVLSVDTIQAEATGVLLDGLNEKFPSLFQQQHQENRRILIVLNKRDLLFDKKNKTEEQAEKQLQRITQHVKHVNKRHLFCYCAKVGLEGHEWSKNPKSVSSDDYKSSDVIPMIRKLPQHKSEVNDIDELKVDGNNAPLEEKIKVMAELMKRSSGIGELEDKILEASSSFKSLKAIDDTKNLAEELIEHVKSKFQSPSECAEIDCYSTSLKKLMSAKNELDRRYNIQPLSSSSSESTA